MFRFDLNPIKPLRPLSLLALNVFAGVGVAADSASDFDDATNRNTRGLGIRYHTARKLGLWAGIDVAEGPEETYWYLQVGSAW